MNTLFYSIKVAALTAGISLASVVIAAPKDRFPIDLAALETKAAERFSTMDTNSDGQVELAEFEAAEMQRPREADRRHKHGKRAGKRYGKRMQEMRAAVQAELFTLLDVNGDGQLSADEHAAQTREISKAARKKAMFKKLDANGDGVLVPDEIPGRGEKLRAADSDGDGQITRQEFRALRAG